MEESKMNKKLFDLCEKNEGLNGKVHIINQSTFEEEQSFRIYHSGGYCFDISKEKVELAEDESSPDSIDGWYYSFFSEWDGFRTIEAQYAIKAITMALKQSK